MIEELHVARPVRRDGWTPARRSRFLTVLAESGDVSVAVRACGLSRPAAYAFRRRDPGFARQWARALTEFVTRGEREYLAVVAQLLARAAPGGRAPNFSPGHCQPHQSHVNFAGPR
jgi:hypothetical protein